MPQGNPLLLSCTLQELLARDTVQVELIPGKKGLFLKHVEYEVSSQVRGRRHVPAGRGGWVGGGAGGMGLEGVCVLVLEGTADTRHGEPSRLTDVCTAGVSPCLHLAQPHPHLAQPALPGPVSGKLLGGALPPPGRCWAPGRASVQ